MSLAMYLLAVLTGFELCIIAIPLANKLTGFSVQPVLMFFITFIFCTAVIYLVNTMVFRRIRRLYLNDNTKLEFLNKAKAEIQYSVNSVLKSKLHILMCEHYFKQNNKKKALESIRLANPFKSTLIFRYLFFLDSENKLNYFLKSIHLNLCFNNIIEAQSAFENGEYIINRFETTRYACDIKSTIAWLEYAKGNYSKADELVSAAIDLNRSIPELEALKLLKAKIYLKLERTEVAHEILESIIINNVSEVIVAEAKQILLKYL